MAPVIVDPDRVHEFADAASFYRWLSVNHDREPEVWIKIHKKASGLPTISPDEAIDASLCWGWIDAIRKSFDETSFLQRYTPRGAKSVWSQVNVEKVARLTAAGRMTEHGLKPVKAAKADGRWDAAYRVSTAEVPEDFRKAIAKSNEAQAMFETLTAQNRFALIFRLMQIKTEAGRKKKIADFVAMLARGETIHPQGKRAR